MTQAQEQPSRFMSPAQMEEIADNRPPELIDGLLPAEGVAILAGAPGTGKSFTALSWAAAVAEGKDWFGRKTNQTSVAYVLGEGYGSFGSRVKAWRAANGRPMSEQVNFLDGVGFGVDLKDSDSVERLIQQLMNVWPGLIIFDTFSMLARVSNENDNAEVAQVMANIHKIVQATNATALLIHHLTKSSGTVRGASAFIGNADTVVIAAPDRRDHPTGKFFLSTLASHGGKRRDGEAKAFYGFNIDSPGVLTRNTGTSAAGTTSARTPLDPNEIIAVARAAHERQKDQEN